MKRNELLEAVGKLLAIVAWTKDENGDNDVVVFTGTFRCADGAYFLDLNEGKEHFVIRP